MTQAEPQAGMKFTPPIALLVMLASVVVVLGYLGLDTALGFRAPYAGFLFLFAWSTVAKSQIDQLLPSLCGAALGLVLASLCVWFPREFGLWSVAVPLSLIAGAVYCLLVGSVTFLVNNSTILYLTVFSIPGVADHAPLSSAFSSLVVACLYFGGLALGGRAVAARRAASSAASSN